VVLLVLLTQSYTSNVKVELEVDGSVTRLLWFLIKFTLCSLIVSSRNF
jgi:hypothetical protein